MKTILVTGANRGIGKAMADILEEKGHRVIRTARKFHEKEEELKIPLDVTDPSSVQTMAVQIAKICGDKGLDVLINNAGVLVDQGVAIEDVTDAQFEATLDVNVKGVFRVSNALFPLLKKNGDAHVIHISSRAGQLGEPMEVSPAYCVSKTALNGLTVQQAMAWERYGIRVNCLSPGWVKTDMGGIEAPLTPQQGADTAVWLATEMSGKVTGKFFSERTVIDW